MSINEICAGYVTYNPNISLLKQSVLAIVNQVDRILIIDNNSTNKDDIRCLRDIDHKICIIFNDSNKGVAVAFNQIGKYAYDYNYKWFLTLDQDSVCPQNMIEIYSLYVSISNVGLICPFIRQRNMVNNKIEWKNHIEYIQIAISSGSLVRTEAWCDVNGFWDKLFIDRVDDDFCLALRDRGWKILQINDVELEHEIGYPIVRNFMGKRYYTDSYPEFRYYYIARNTLLVSAYYKNLPYNSLKLLCKRLLKILLGEDGKIKKLRSFMHGIFDGLNMISKGVQRD